MITLEERAFVVECIREFNGNGNKWASGPIDDDAIARTSSGTTTLGTILQLVSIAPGLEVFG